MEQTKITTSVYNVLDILIDYDKPAVKKAFYAYKTGNLYKLLPVHQNIYNYLFSKIPEYYLNDILQ